MFIIDQNGHLIAAESTDLARWGVADILEAAQAFARGSLKLNTEESTLRLENGRELSYRGERMESLLGAWTLFRLPTEASLSTEGPSAEAHTLEVGETVAEKAILEMEEPQSEEARPTSSKLEEEVDEELEALLKLLPEEEEKESSVTESAEAPQRSIESEEEELLPLLEETPSEEEPSETETQEISSQEEAPTSAEEDSFELHTPTEERELSIEEEESSLKLMPEEEESSTGTQESPLELQVTTEEEEPSLELLEEETAPLELEDESPVPPISEKAPTPKKPEWETIQEEFNPDIEANASRLNLDSEEYRNLVQDLGQDIEQMRSKLLSDDFEERHEAIAVLKDAILLLQLSPLDRLLSLLEEARMEDRLPIVDTLDRLLQSLTESPTQGEKVPRSFQEVAKKISTTSTITKEPELPAEEIEEKEEPTPEISKPQSNIDEFLKGVEPIPISFSLHVAAEELSLPEDLVQEFVTDFANQGHEYLPVLIEAYEEKDLDKLQKTAHMLKGAASNLRVEAMVENLYELQFDNDIERAPDRIRKFAGQLMSLDNFLKQLNG
jgi:HPt (histidine-containing phosphotransfer) domain-containing protein